jgi:hypothetical protein
LGFFCYFFWASFGRIFDGFHHAFGRCYSVRFATIVLDDPRRVRIFLYCLAWADDVIRSAGDLVERIVLSQPSDKRSSQLQGMPPVRLFDPIDICRPQW